MLTCAFWSVSVLQPFATCLISDCQYTAKKAVKASTQHQSRTRGVTVLLNRILIPCLVGATHEGPRLSRSGAPVGASSPLELRSARRRGSLIETWRPRGCYWQLETRTCGQRRTGAEAGWRGDETLPLLFSKLSLAALRLSPAKCGECVSLIRCCVWEPSSCDKMRVAMLAVAVLQCMRYLPGGTVYA